MEEKVKKRNRVQVRSEPIKKVDQKATKIPKAKFPSEGKWGISKYKLRFGITEFT